MVGSSITILRHSSNQNFPSLNLNRWDLNQKSSSDESATSSSSSTPSTTPSSSTFLHDSLLPAILQDQIQIHDSIVWSGFVGGFFQSNLQLHQILQDSPGFFRIVRDSPQSWIHLRMDQARWFFWRILPTDSSIKTQWSLPSPPPLPHPPTNPITHSTASNQLHPSLLKHKSGNQL